jgi:transcriptional regulator with XRE-family HTH domain
MELEQQQRDREAAELRAAMQEQHYSAASLAKKAGVSKNTVGRALAGDPTRDGTIRKLHKALGILPKTAPEAGVFDVDVESAAMAVKVYLAGLDQVERPPAIAALIKCVAGAAVEHARTHPNG